MARAKTAGATRVATKTAAKKKATTRATVKPAAKKKATRATVKPAAKKKATTRATVKPAAKKPPRVSTHPLKQRTPTAERLVERLRAICLALPDVTEQIAWGEPTWRVGGRMFAVLDTYHHGSAHLSVHLAAPAGAQAALIDSDPARFFRPPYVGGKGWVAMILDTDPDWGMVAALVETARAEVAAPRR